MRLPNLKYLQAFECSARHLNFRLASEELNVTQGAVAQQVRKLEAELSVVLFIRKARGLELSAAGRQYFREVQRALSIIRQATQTLTPQTSKVVLSVPPSFAAKWLVPRLAKFETKYPDIDLQIVASESLSKFETDGVDIAVRQTSNDIEDNLLSHRLFPFALVAVASPEYANTTPAIAAVSDFSDQKLLQDAHALWDRLFQHNNIERDIRKQQFNQTALAIDAAVNGRGIALVPSVLIADEIDKQTLKILWRDPVDPRSHYYVVRPKENQSQQDQTSAVWQWLVEEATACNNVV